MDLNFSIPIILFSLLLEPREFRVDSVAPAGLVLCF